VPMHRHIVHPPPFFVSPISASVNPTIVLYSATKFLQRSGVARWCDCWCSWSLADMFQCLPHRRKLCEELASAAIFPSLMPAALDHQLTQHAQIWPRAIAAMRNRVRLETWRAHDRAAGRHWLSRHRAPRLHTTAPKPQAPQLQRTAV